jgi:hypothetical protein
MQRRYVCMYVCIAIQPGQKIKSFKQSKPYLDFLGGRGELKLCFNVEVQYVESQNVKK